MRPCRDQDESHEKPFHAIAALRSAQALSLGGRSARAAAGSPRQARRVQERRWRRRLGLPAMPGRWAIRRRRGFRRAFGSPNDALPLDAGRDQPFNGAISLAAGSQILYAATRPAARHAGIPLTSHAMKIALCVLAGVALTTWSGCGPAAPASPWPEVWFVGDFESGTLAGWDRDVARSESAVVVDRPVRRGRHAARITLAPGDRAASKERAELKIADKDIERVHGRQGSEIWYGWSFLLPVDYADPPGDQFQIVAQWHHRPVAPPTAPDRPFLSGPPPLALHLAPGEDGDLLILVAQATPSSPPRVLALRPIRRGTWIDLVFAIRCSTGSDGWVAAWIDGLPFTPSRMPGPTLYTPVANYLRIGLYRAKGVPTTNHIYLDEVRVGNSYAAVAPQARTSPRASLPRHSATWAVVSSRAGTRSSCASRQASFPGR
jgi:hypothetical protein